MIKEELVARVACKAGISKAAAQRVIEEILCEIKGALSRGETVRLLNFGTFSVRNRAKHTGSDPRTGKTIEIPPTRVPAFHAAKSVKKKMACTR